MRDQPDCYDYVRRFYGVPAYIGVRVSVRGRDGALVNHRPSDQYVYIRFDGDRRVSGPYHPTDEITYRPEVSVEAMTPRETTPGAGR